MLIFVGTFWFSCGFFFAAKRFFQRALPGQTGCLCKQHNLKGSSGRMWRRRGRNFSFILFLLLWTISSQVKDKADDGPDESQIWCGYWWLSSNSCGSVGGMCVRCVSLRTSHVESLLSHTASRWLGEEVTYATVNQLNSRDLTRQYFVSASTCSLRYCDCDQQWLILTQTSSRVFV